MAITSYDEQASGAADPRLRTDCAPSIAFHRPTLSIVAPCYNEEASIPGFHDAVVKAARLVVGEDFELVLVNDGSRDRTWPMIVELSERCSQVVGVSLSRNHGHQLAVTAGLRVASGARVLVIDADLQDPPEVLSEMMAVMDQGYDVVYGRRRRRVGESPFKLATAAAFYALLRRLSDVDIPQEVGDFRLMSRRIVDRFNAMPEHDRFIRGMVAWLGGRQTEILYDRAPRVAGSSAYTLPRMIGLAVDGLTSFSTAPLKAALVLAGIGITLGVFIAMYAMVGLAVGRPERGWTSLSLMIIFFGVSQLGCLAIIGAYVGRIYMQVKGRPLFLIDEVVTHHGHDGIAGG